MKKRILLQAASVAMIVTFATGCIVINVSRSDDKKPKPTAEQEEVVIEKQHHN